MKKELYAKIEVDNLLAVGDVFFPWGNKPCHQICFYYKIQLLENNIIPLDGVFQGYDETDNKRIELDFCWVPLKELSLHSYRDKHFENCLFQSPIVNMEYLMQQMYIWFHISEEQLRSQGEIETPIETMSWQYCVYVKEHPIDKWTTPTHILYGAKDNLQSRRVIDDFVSEFNCQLTVSETSEHPFMDEKDGIIVATWIMVPLLIMENKGDKLKIKAYKNNTFAKTMDGGNPAGVVLDADLLSEDNMKMIAGIFGFSETAFIMKSDVADFKVRFFTPNEEVDFCGHATVGTYSVLLSKGLIRPGKYTQETKAGILSVEVKKDTTIIMNQTLPIFCEVLDVEEIADSLNTSVDNINTDIPIQIVTTGLRDIMVPIKTIDILNKIKPDFDKVAEISKKYKVVGYHMFTLDSLYRSNAYCRNLAPLYGIPEESATGTSNGALACYLFKQGVLSAKNCEHMIFEQGYSMNLPSEIIVSLSVVANEIKEVKVGGKALNLCEVVIEI
ncbi:MAG: PhzF family phenazine biosynthesis isomerase [Lachnotalea sp.]